MLARTRSSLTAGGPTCLISTFSTTSPVCAARNVSQPGASSPSSSQHRHRNNFIQLTVNRHVVGADFGGAFKARVGLQKGQRNITGRPVALFGNQQIHRQRILLLRGTVVVFSAAGLVK